MGKIGIILWGILSMNMAYQEFLERLKKERINKNLSQMQMGRKLKMSQSHYSKAELGTRRFTYFEMQCLCDTEVDIFYILTGTEYEGKYKRVLEEKSYDELTFLMRIVCYANEYHRKKDAYYYEDVLTDKMGMEQYALTRDRQNNILYSVRRMKNYNQKKMSEILEVDVKKLRDMEKGITLPDSEIILKMHTTFSIPFFVILKEKNLLISELCYMIELLEKSTRKEVYGLIQDCFSILE